MRGWVLWCGTVGLLGTALSASMADEKAAADGLPWALRTPTRPALPAIKNQAWVRNPVDAFILSQLEEVGLAVSPAADRATLLRRVTFDLIGLPPTPEHLDAFLKDRSVDAYEKVVDRLLQSPRYGERWAMYWLDLVRYAESDGFKADDTRPNAWRYRDYVIKSFNDDKPYDRFIKEQLAGDELYPGDRDALAATAFNRHFPDEYNARNLELRRQEILNDMTDTTGQVFLGLTVGCARCHDHKYDPISQKDYFRLQAFFAGYLAKDDLPLTRTEEAEAYQASLIHWQAKTAELRRRMAELEDPYRKRQVSENKSKFAAHLQAAYDMPAEQRTPMQAQLASMLAKQLEVDRTLMEKAMKPGVRTEWQELNKRLSQFDKDKPTPLAVTPGITDVGPAAPATHLLVRGDYKKKGEVLLPGFLTVLDHRPVSIPAPKETRTTGRRAVLAEWLTRPDHPLTARVMVNRLWQHHFGRGIVGTPSDFGELGQQPTHPELLNWLAREFVERGWSLKAMHRLIVTSASYRQASKWRPEAAKVDPDNELLWRMRPRRLEGEALRDAMLAVSGLLNDKMGGPSVFPELPAELKVRNWTVTADARERQRRSVYVFVKRNVRYPLFGAFDAPDTNESCARRHVSTNAPQALMLLNDKITLDMARAFAGRVLSASAADPRQVAEHVYRCALGRTAQEPEAKAAVDFLTRETEIVRQRLADRLPVAVPTPAPTGTDPAFGAAVVDLCHVVLNLNEFLYVD
jgi:hypothetical protein